EKKNRGQGKRERETERDRERKRERERERESEREHFSVLLTQTLFPGSSTAFGRHSHDRSGRNRDLEQQWHRGEQCDKYRQCDVMRQSQSHVRHLKKEKNNPVRP